MLKVVAKTHVQHLVRFVQHCDAQRRQVKRAPFQMIPKPTRRTDDDMRAVIEAASFLGRVHPADAG